MLEKQTSRRDFLKVSSLTAAGMAAGCRPDHPQTLSDPTRFSVSASSVTEPARQIPIVHKCDICVVGAGSAGTFAAVRAARMGASVGLIENNGFFGGVATAAKVNVWHSLFDTEGKQQIIAGLTEEVISRLRRRGAANIYAKDQSRYADFNTAEMIFALDELVTAEKSIRPFLHARFVDAAGNDGLMTHAIIEDKSGRRAIAADYFIDATGDGDVIARMNLPFTKRPDPQPPTTCAVLTNLDRLAAENPNFDLAKAIFDPDNPDALSHGFLWKSPVPNVSGLTMVYGTRVNNADCSDADQLTAAEFEGRRQAKAIRDILFKNFKSGHKTQTVALSSYIGIRETRHANCLYTVSESDVLTGRRFPDAVANGSYRIDVHHSDKPGLTFKYLDGTQVYNVPGKSPVKSRWRDPISENPTFYQIPYRSLIPQGSANILVTGRLVDADRAAYGALRVMVNGNQTGEAVAAAAILAAGEQIPVTEVNPQKLRKTLTQNNAIII